MKSKETLPTEKSLLQFSDINFEAPSGYFMSGRDNNGKLYVDILASEANPSKTISNRPRNNMIIEFDVTNHGGTEAAIRKISIEVQDFIPVREVAAELHSGGGKAGKYECRISSELRFYQSKFLDGKFDYLKVGKGDVERISVNVTSDAAGIYKLAAWMEVTEAGRAVKIKVGELPALVGFIDKLPTPE